MDIVRPHCLAAVSIISGMRLMYWSDWSRGWRNRFHGIRNMRLSRCQDIVVLGVSRRLLTRRSGVRFQLDHVLFILSVRHAIPSYCVWKRIYSVRNEGRPAAGNQRQARKWRRQVSSKRTKEAQRSTLNQSKKDVLGGDGQNAWLNVYMLTL